MTSWLLKLVSKKVLFIENGSSDAWHKLQTLTTMHSTSNPDFNQEWLECKLTI